MTWEELIGDVAERSDVSRAQARKILSTLCAVVVERVCEGETVVLPNIGSLQRQWRSSRALRSISDGRTILVDGRFMPRFRPAGALRRALSGTTPQFAADPQHQAAWRIAETLISDLDLYHSADAPRGLMPGTDSETVHVACSIAFGTLWPHVTHTYETEVPESIRMQRDHLAEAALRRWGAKS